MRARPRTVHGIDPYAPGGVARLLEFRRQRHGGLMMTAPVTTETGGQQTGGEGGQQSTETGGAQQGGAGTEGGAPEPKKLDITQADLDRIIGQRVADEQGKWQKKLDDAAALAGKSETDRLTIERDQAKAAAAETTQKAAERIAKTEAKVAAIAAGANPDRVAAIVRNADLTAAVKDGDVDEAAIKAAVDKVLTEYPEWKKTTHTGPSSSGGELNGGGNGKPTFTRKQLEEMPSEEMAARIDEINEAIADGRVTG